MRRLLTALICSMLGAGTVAVATSSTSVAGTGGPDLEVVSASLLSPGMSPTIPKLSPEPAAPGYESTADDVKTLAGGYQVAGTVTDGGGEGDFFVADISSPDLGMSGGGDANLAAPFDANVRAGTIDVSGGDDRMRGPRMPMPGFLPSVNLSVKRFLVGETVVGGETEMAVALNPIFWAAQGQFSPPPAATVPLPGGERAVAWDALAYGGCVVPPNVSFNVAVVAGIAETDAGPELVLAGLDPVTLDPVKDFGTDGFMYTGTHPTGPPVLGPGQAEKYENGPTIYGFVVAAPVAGPGGTVVSLQMYDGCGSVVHQWGDGGAGAIDLGPGDDRVGTMNGPLLIGEAEGPSGTTDVAVAWMNPYGPTVPGDPWYSVGYLDLGAGEDEELASALLLPTCGDGYALLHYGGWAPPGQCPPTAPGEMALWIAARVGHKIATGQVKLKVAVFPAAWGNPFAFEIVEPPGKPAVLSAPGSKAVNAVPQWQATSTGTPPWDTVHMTYKDRVVFGETGGPRMVLAATASSGLSQPIGVSQTWGAAASVYGGEVLVAPKAIYGDAWAAWELSSMWASLLSGSPYPFKPGVSP